MTRTFWLGLGSGLLALALVAPTVPHPSSEPAPVQDDLVEQRLPDPVSARCDAPQPAPAVDARGEDVTATRPELRELLRERNLAPAARALHAAFAEGTIGKPELVQLAAGHPDLIDAFLREAGVLSPGLETLLDPPSHDELGREMRGAVVCSIEYHKGRWSDRPAQLLCGDLVVSIGGERITSAAAFQQALAKHHDLVAGDMVDAGVFRPVAKDPRELAFTTVRLDQGDLQLVYGVCTVERR